MNDYSDTAMVLYYILTILERKSDNEETRYLSQSEIADELTRTYGITPDRKTIKKQLENYATINTVKNAISQNFGWIFGTGIKIEGPKKVVEDYVTYMKNQLEEYS